jgi:hypothetical protein
MPKKTKAPDPWEDFFEDIRSRLKKYRSNPPWTETDFLKVSLGLVNWQGAVMGTADYLVTNGLLDDAVALHDLQEALAETAAYTLWLCRGVTSQVNSLGNSQRGTNPDFIEGQMSIFDVLAEAPA